MKQHITLLFLLILCLSGTSQTVIPLPGFQAVLKEFPTMSGDTITAQFSITDFSNQWRGQDLNDREHLVLWRNCKRYPILEVVQAFSTEVIVKLDKDGNPNLLPGVCALLQETPGQMVSHLISGITDSDKQCIDSYYRVDALAGDTTNCCIDTSITNELQTLSTTGASGNISISSGNTITLNVNDADANPSNELQTLSTNGTAGNISISSGNMLTLNINDADANSSNEGRLGVSAEDSNASRITSNTTGANGVRIAGSNTVKVTETTNTNGGSINFNVDTAKISTIYYVDSVLSSVPSDPDSIQRIGNVISLRDGSGSVNLSDLVNAADSTIVVSGTGINVVESPDHTFTVNNTAPDQTVTIGQSGIVTVTGAYPNFTVGATEVDGSITNEIQDISTTGAPGNISLSSGSTLNLNVNDADASSTNELQQVDTFSIVSNQLRLSLTQDAQLFRSVDLSPYVNTDAQTLSTSGAAGNITISSGNTLNINVNDADASATNEIQSLSRSGQDLTISSSNTVTFPTATAAVNGWLSSTDWSTFNGKPNGSGAAGRAAFWSASNTLSSDGGFLWDNLNKRLGINKNPGYDLDISGRIGLSGAGGAWNTFINGGNTTLTGLGNFAGGSNQTLSSLTTGSNNVANGNGAGFSCTTCSDCFSFGRQAGFSNVSGNNRVDIGAEAGFLGTGSSMINLGVGAGRNKTISENGINIGNLSGYANSGNDEVNIGYYAGFNATGSRSLRMGAFSGQNSGASVESLFLGPYSGFGAVGTRNIFIGPYAGYNAGSVNDVLYIENWSSNTPLIGGRFNTDRVGINKDISSLATTLHVGGDMTLDTRTGTAATIAAYDSNGKLCTAGLSGLSVSGGNLTAADPSLSNELITAVTSMGTLSGGNTIVITEAGVSRTGIIPPMTGATAGVAGVQGVVPAPAAGQNNHFLRGDGTWQTVSTGVTGSGTATQVAYWNGSNTLTGNSNLFWNNTNVRLGIGTSSPTQTLQINSASGAYTNAKGILMSHGSATQQLFIGHTGATQAQITMNESNFAGNSGIYINSNGDQIGIKTPSTTQTLDVNGNTRIRGAIMDSGNSSGTAGQTIRSAGAGAFTWGDNVTVEVFTTPGTYNWVKPANCKAVYVKCIGGGGGGAGGNKGAAGVFTAGGEGGDGGGVSEWTFNESELILNNTIIVGAGGTGGAGATLNNSNGAGGTDGESSSFKNIIAEGGRRGDPSLSKLSMGITEDGGYGARRLDDATSQQATVTKVAGCGGGGGGSISSADVIIPVVPNGETRLFTGSFATPSIVGSFGGAGGAASTTGNGTNGSTAGSSKFGGGGGGGGAARNSVGNGGNGGNGRGGAVMVITYF